MDASEFEGWKKETEKSKDFWSVDKIHNGAEGQDLLLYKGGASGHYAAFSPDGWVQLGSYEHAVPHIGEACFSPLNSHQFASMQEAVDRFTRALGPSFLITLTLGRSPYSNAPKIPVS